jgi:hypothetical protein
MPKKTFEERVDEILEQKDGRSISGSFEDGFVVTNKKNEKHKVQMIDEFSGFCDCMDFVIRGRGMEGYQCKHIAASSRLVQKQMNEAIALEEFQSVHYP